MDSISFFWSFFKMLGALSVVIALMIVAMYFMKKFFSRPMTEMQTGAAINIVSTRYLGPKSSIMLIEVLGQLLLVGISDRQMSMLTTINDPAALEKIKSLHLEQGFLSASDPLSRYRSLFKNFGRQRKGI